MAQQAMMLTLFSVFAADMAIVDSAIADADELFIEMLPALTARQRAYSRDARGAR